MNQGRYVFMQLVDFLPRKNFEWLVKKYEGNKYIKKFKGEKGNRVGGKKEGKKKREKKDPKAYPLGSFLFSAPIGAYCFVNYALAATEIQSKTNEQIPKATMPTVQMARANLVEQALWKVGSGLSLCLMNIAFTMSK